MAKNADPVCVTYDHREWAGGVPGALAREFPEIELQAAQLQLGDYLISDRMVVERKALADLQQSMLDRRLFRQVEQLREHYERVVVIVELGKTREGHWRRRMHRGQEGALAWCLRQGASVLTVRDTADTARWIARLAKQEHAPGRIRSDVRRKPQDPDALLRALVSHAPGIGANTAHALLTHFGSLHAVIDADAKSLQTVPGIGKKRASQLAELFHRPYEESPDLGGSFEPKAAAGLPYEIVEVPDGPPPAAERGPKPTRRASSKNKPAASDVVDLEPDSGIEEADVLPWE